MQLIKQCSLISLLVVSGGLAACSPESKPTVEAALSAQITQEQAKEQPMAAQDKDAAAAELAALMAQIKQQIGTATASSVAECKVVGVGHKPCGGPAFYLAYSTAVSDEAQLLLLIERYSALDKAQNNRLGMISDCAITPPPGVQLRDGVCQLSTAADLY